MGFASFDVFAFSFSHSLWLSLGIGCNDWRNREQTKRKIILEVDTIKQFVEGLRANSDIILLDNMDLRTIKKVVALKKEQKSRCLLEVSGGVKLRNIRSLAKIGVDRISIGALTHSVRSIDFSLEFLGEFKTGVSL